MDKSTPKETVFTNKNAPTAHQIYASLQNTDLSTRIISETKDQAQFDENIQIINLVNRELSKLVFI